MVLHTLRSRRILQGNPSFNMVLHTLGSRRILQGNPSFNMVLHTLGQGAYSKVTPASTRMK
jgi:hypothetical protein